MTQPTDAVPVTDVAILGGGISGLAAAWRLHQRGRRVVLIESTERTGGNILTEVPADGWLFDAGPSSFLATSDGIWQVVQELGIEPRVLQSRPAGKTRFIFFRGKLRPLPMGPLAFLGTSLLSPLAKLRLMMEPLNRSHPPDGNEETVAEFFRRRLGQQATERMVGPFVSGVYAGDPAQLSAEAAFPLTVGWERDHGSIVRGVMARVKERKVAAKAEGRKHKRLNALYNFDHGMEVLPRVLTQRLGDVVRTNTRVTALQPGSGVVTLTLDRNGQRETLTAKRLLLAVPAHAAAELLADVLPDVVAPLREFAYPPVWEVFLGWRRKSLRHALDGFGYLIPRIEGVRHLGTIFSSTNFPGRAPDEQHACTTTFLGGATDLNAGALSEAQVIDTVLAELDRTIGVTGEPVLRRAILYPRGIPQYTLGHLDRIARIERALASIPGLAMTGNHMGGIAIGKCVEHALATAERLDAEL